MASFAQMQPPSRPQQVAGTAAVADAMSLILIVVTEGEVLVG